MRMSEETVKTTVDQLAIIPETEFIEPVVQCGVLYLGTAPPSPGRRGLDSIQEPFSHRYPVDGTNTVRGIDSVLSIYDNGIQLTFARQPHTVIFFPMSSLIYCASLRFSIVENDQTSSIDWRFVTLDSTLNNQSKHPPLFCAVVQRTQILSGDECHCFITKSDDAALALVRTISDVYAKLSSNIKPLKSPIFYQLDRYGRKISETSGVIYLSPATDDESQLNQITDRSSSIPRINRNSLLDPSLDGFFYRTDGHLIEQWQLWDDDDLTGSRPHPPPSPFGQHQALYHDDLTQEMHQYLRHMDDEEHSSSCSCSSSSNSSKEYNRVRHGRQKSKYDTEQVDISFSQSSSFDPAMLSVQNNTDIKKAQPAPIIIEKVVPNPIMTIPQNHPTYRMQSFNSSIPIQQSFNPSIPIQQTTVNYAPYSDDYHINERGEKITSEGNRIIYMDVIQPNTIIPNFQPPPYTTQPPPYTTQPPLYTTQPPPYTTQSVRSYSHRRRSKHIPIINLQSIENLFNEKKSKQRQTNIYDNEKNLSEQQLTTSDMLEIVEGYFEDYKGRRIQLDGHDAQAMLGHLEPSSKKDHRRPDSVNKKTHRRRRSYSTINIASSINYVEKSVIKSPSQHSSIHKQAEYNNEQANDYVSGVYGTSRSITTPTNHQETQRVNTVTLPDQDFISPFRYMQSSMNPLLLREYRNTFSGV